MSSHKNLLGPKTVVPRHFHIKVHREYIYKASSDFSKCFQRAAHVWPRAERINILTSSKSTGKEGIEEINRDGKNKMYLEKENPWRKLSPKAMKLAITEPEFEP